MNYYVISSVSDALTRFNAGNCVCEIRTNLNFSNQDVNIADNCVLRFNGGRFLNAHIYSNNCIIESPLIKIFQNCTFSGNFLNINIFQIEWFVDNYETSFVFNSTKDARNEIQGAINSGIKKIHFNNVKYFPISGTLTINNNIDITGVKRHLDASKTWFLHEPCIYSKDVVTLLQYNFDASSGNPSQSKPRLSIEGLNLCCCKPFVNGESGVETPIVEINNMGSLSLWGLFININVIVANGNQLISDGFRYTGIKVFSQTKPITLIEFAGSVSMAYKAFDVRSNGSVSINWITDVKIWADTICVRGGDFESYTAVYPVINYGSHQMVGFFNEYNNDEAYFRAGSFKNHGYIWDAGCMGDNGKWYCRYAVMYYSGDSGVRPDHSQEQYCDALIVTPPDSFYPNLLVDKTIKYGDIGITSDTRLQAFPKSNNEDTPYEFIDLAEDVTLNFLRYKFPKRLCRWDNSYYNFSHRSDVSFCSISPSDNTRNFIYDETIQIIRSNKIAPVQDMPPLYVCPPSPIEAFTITIQYYELASDTVPSKTVNINHTNDSNDVNNTNSIYNIRKYGDYIKVTDIFLRHHVKNDYYRSSKTIISLHQVITKDTELVPRAMFFIPNYHATDIIRGGSTCSDVKLAVEDKGEMFYHTSYGQLWWNGTKWVEFDKANAGVKRSGTFGNKPSSGIYVGYQYFCTSGAKVAGSSVSNIIIYYTGNGWVDALGRTVTS